MTRISAPRATALAALALLTAACSAPGTSLRYDKTHPIAVTEAPQILELPLEEALSAESGRLLDVFAQRFTADGEGEITIAYPNDVDAGLSSRAVSAAARRLAAAGVAREKILRGPYDAASEAMDGLVVTFDASTAFSSGCPEVWSDPTRDTTNKSPARFGCATQNNLAAMIDRPTDLDAPRAVTPADAQRREVVIENYRKGEATASKKDAQQTDTRR